LVLTGFVGLTRAAGDAFLGFGFIAAELKIAREFIFIAYPGHAAGLSILLAAEEQEAVEKKRRGFDFHATIHLWARGGYAVNHPFGTDVFVNVRPVDAFHRL
jgi:hypothetical protein